LEQKEAGLRYSRVAAASRGSGLSRAPNGGLPTQIDSLLSFMARKKPTSRMWWDDALEALTTLGIDMYKAFKDPDGTCVRPRSSKEKKKKLPTPRKRAPVRWWKVLGVLPSATPQQIKAAYRARMHESHPDKVAHLSPALRKAADREAKRINDAYERSRQG
jgi:DnaJ-domain-containing protein 1